MLEYGRLSTYLGVFFVFCFGLYCLIFPSRAFELVRKHKPVNKSGDGAEIADGNVRGQLTTRLVGLFAAAGSLFCGSVLLGSNFNSKEYELVGTFLNAFVFFCVGLYCASRPTQVLELVRKNNPRKECE